MCSHCTLMTSFGKKIKLFSVYFSLAHVLSDDIDGIYDLYCFQPPGSNGDVLPSLLGGSHAVHLYF